MGAKKRKVPWKRKSWWSNWKVLNAQRQEGHSREEGQHMQRHGPNENEVQVLVAQLCPTLCKPMDCNLLGSSVHGISQARILEWVVIPFFKRSSSPMDWTSVSWIAGRFFTIWATREVPSENAVGELQETGMQMKSEREGGHPWWSSGEDSELPLHRVWVWSLVRELRSQNGLVKIFFN